ncbi:serine hydrolase domain-containing protein [Paracraurococcus lichenis]|uniref:Serine hydrolase domain-containing protein n=1 Tax=Paracraurococcus lichenis TaxID=3064888 RepID=A0ABT9DW17_9PROT|nr:serine hydrolase domain-containing protein [Paracraurococcus sp. LOR1-02]MDO9708089.1 serine hydrolase domain-containing protein [Paracraurococcus sp. LOR1-02]
MTDLGLLALRRAARRLLAPWDRGESPGATIGLVRDGALALHESAGAASLELGLPIGPETCFRIASVSKQFTCAAILLLEAEGRLSREDAVQRHLPGLPDLGARITLDHLMRNCSGLRDMLELMRFAGTGLGQPATAEQLLDAIGRQRSLNFAPNTRFLYSNSGFLLLGRVVEAAAGEPLATFLERRILAPLGMTRTRHTPSVAEVVPGLATGYFPQGEGFVRAPHGFALGGEGGLVSCVEDLALWDRNFSTGLVGGVALGRALAERVPFGNGRLNLYARGLEVADYRGLRTETHGGLWPGYRTCFLRAPEAGLTVIVIANHGGIDVHQLGHRMLDAAVEGRPGIHPVPALPPRPALEALTGRWLEPESGTTLEIELTADGTPRATQHGLPFTLAPAEDGRLVAQRGAFPFALSLPEDGRLLVETDAGIITSFRRAATEARLPEGLEGAWTCAELDATWTIAPGTEGLVLRVRGPVGSDGPWPVLPIEGDCFRVLTPATLFQGWVDAQAVRDAAGRVAGFLVNGSRARGLRFGRDA